MEHVAERADVTGILREARALAAGSHVARAQHAERVRTLRALMAFKKDDPSAQSRATVFRQTLRRPRYPRGRAGSLPVSCLASSAGHSPASFDHLVGDGEQLRMKFQTERFCSLQIDDQFNFVGLKHRQVTRAFALQDSSDIKTHLMKSI